MEDNPLGEPNAKAGHEDVDIIVAVFGRSGLGSAGTHQCIEVNQYHSAFDKG